MSANESPAPAPATSTAKTFKLPSEGMTIVRELHAARQRWWVRSRPCRRAVQLNAGDGTPPCQEFFVPWWAWPFELCHRLLFPPPRLLHVPFADYPEIERHFRKWCLPGVVTPARDELAVLRAALREANDLCRSLHAIAQREGLATNWPAIRQRLGGVLAKQHALRQELGLYP